MGELFKVGKVTVGYTDRDDAKLTAKMISILTNPPQSGEDKVLFTTLEWPLEVLRAAIPLAPQIVEVAMKQLTDLLEHSKKGAQERNSVAERASLILYKYFHLLPDVSAHAANDPIWVKIQKIQKLLDVVHKGLTSEYQIDLFEKAGSAVKGDTKATTAAAFVTHKDTPTSNELHELQREFFRNDEAPIERGHIEPTGNYTTSNIHLSLDWIRALRPVWTTGKTPELTKQLAIEVATVIIHEGSHKWAHTKDVCYKWATINEQRKKTLEGRLKQKKDALLAILKLVPGKVREELEKKLESMSDAEQTELQKHLSDALFWKNEIDKKVTALKAELSKKPNREKQQELDKLTILQKKDWYDLRYWLLKPDQEISELKEFKKNFLANGGVQPNPNYAMSPDPDKQEAAEKGVAIPDAEWLINADSYAQAARSLYKHSPQVKTKG